LTWQDAGVADSASRPVDPVVIRISPMSYFAVFFLSISLLALVTVIPWTAPLLVIPVLLFALIARLRTVADRDTVTARTLFGSKTVDWDDIAGLKFVKSSWGRADLKNGGELALPAVTFATLPLLTEASGGRVPNPYS
jgi:Bacterial PH domain